MNQKTNVQFQYLNKGKTDYILAVMLALVIGFRYEGIAPSQIAKGFGAPMQAWWQWTLFCAGMMCAFLVGKSYSWTLSETGVTFQLGVLKKHKDWDTYPFVGLIPPDVLWLNGEKSGKKALYFSTKQLVASKRPPHGCHIMNYTPELEIILSRLCPNLSPLNKQIPSSPTLKCWSEEEIKRNRILAYWYDIIPALALLPGIISALFIESAYICIPVIAFSVFLYMRLEKRFAAKCDNHEKEYQTAILFMMEEESKFKYPQ